MNTRFKKRLAGIAVGATAAATTAVGLVQPAVAEARFDRTQPTWTDCGPKICTQYWSVDATASLDAYMRSWFYHWAQSGEESLSEAAGTIPKSVYDSATGELRDDADEFASAAETAATYDGCVQRAWKKGQEDGPNTYSYTTHPGYCYTEVEESIVGEDGYVYYYNADLDSYVVSF